MRKNHTLHRIMAGILHKTKGIVLKTVKFGETSLVVTVYTELFGLQSYLVNGVRTATKSGNIKANFFQPAALVDLVVYYNEFKQLNRIREYKWAHLYRHLFSDVFKNGVAMFMVELLAKCIKEPEANEALFAFAEDCLQHLDTASDAEMANFPIFFALQLTNFFGFLPRTAFPGVLEDKDVIFDLKEGVFTNHLPHHNHYLQKNDARIAAEILQVQQPHELSQVSANGDARRKILEALEIYYASQLPDFGKLKTLPVLREILR